MDIKKCADCNLEKEIEHFYFSKNNNNKLRTVCKKCYSLRSAKWRKTLRSTQDGWARDVIIAIRARAKKNNIPFSITPKDIIIPEFCPIRNTKFVFSDRAHPDKPSVDRRYPHLGYVPNNIYVISARANMIKSDCTDPEVFKRMAEWLIQTQ
jgi:hypothetical protein